MPSVSATICFCSVTEELPISLDGVNSTQVPSQFILSIRPVIRNNFV